MSSSPALELRRGVLPAYDDVLTPEALAALEALAPLDDARREVMAQRRPAPARAGAARARRSRSRPRATPSRARRCAWRTPGPAGSTAPTSRPTCAASGSRARAPRPGRGRASRPGLRNVAYALLSGADGWMFDGEDALGQVDTMSLDNQRNLRLAFAMDPRFLDVAEGVADEMNAWAEGFLGRRIVDDWRAQLAFTTRIYRARGLHLDDRHVRRRDGEGFSRLDRGRRAVRRRERGDAPRRGPVRRPVPAQDPGRGRGRRLGAAPRRARGAPRAAGRDDPGLRARRAARGGVPADGDPRRARPPLRRLQHRALGLHQLGVGRAPRRPGVREPEHRRDHDDLRVHARLRGPRAARRQHARRRRAASRCGRAAWRRRSRSGRPPASTRRWRRPSPARSASSARAPAASGSPTGRWSTSCGRSGSAPARPTSWAAPSRR